MNTKISVRYMTQTAAIAALYIAFTFISSAFGLSSGVIQIRISEALAVLPIFTPAAVWGLCIGCALANMLTGSIALDVICGSVATLIGAILTRKLKKHRIAALLAPVASNTLIIPFVLAYGYGINGSVPYFMLTVGLGELISCGGLGYALAAALERRIGL